MKADGRITRFLALLVAVLLLVLGLLQPLVTPVTPDSLHTFLVASLDVTAALLIAVVVAAGSILGKERSGDRQAEAIGRNRADGLVADVIILSTGLFAAVFGILFGTAPANMAIAVIATWVLGISILALSIYDVSRAGRSRRA